MLKYAMSETKIFRSRMAPSPTGDIHIGTLRTGLYAYALAKQNNGQFILRIEDTDQKRLVPGAADRTLQVFKDFALMYDEGPDIGGPFGPYTQTERLDIYQKYIKELLESGHAYHCFCTQDRLNEVRATQKAAKKVPKYDRHCLNLSKDEIQKNLDNKIPYVIRMKIPDNETIVFEDLVRGQIKFNSNDLDDQVLVKSNGIPTYHFAVVVDDHLMQISHIIRSDEWISSTPKHVLLYRYFGWELPQIAHLTVLLDPTHPGKMSKRYGSVFARQFLDDGYLPEAMLNFLMLLGWNPGDDRELFTLKEFVKEFSIDRLHKKAAIFDRKKLDYFNGLYIRQKSDNELVKLLKPFIPQASDEILQKIIPLVKERMVTLKQAANQTKFLFEDLNYNGDLLTLKVDSDTAKNMLQKSIDIINQFDSLKDSDIENLKNKFQKTIEDNNWKVGDFFMVFRVAITGSGQTPPIVESLPLLGNTKTLKNLNLALSKLSP